MDILKCERKKCDSLETSFKLLEAFQKPETEAHLAGVRLQSASRKEQSVLKLFLSVNIFIFISFLPSVSKTLFADCLKNRYGK